MSFFLTYKLRGVAVSPHYSQEQQDQKDQQDPKSQSFRFRTKLIQAAHFNLLWPNKIYIIGVMEEFKTGAAFTLRKKKRAQVSWNFSEIGDELDTLWSFNRAKITIFSGKTHYFCGMMLKNRNRFSGFRTSYQLLSIFFPQTLTSLFDATSCHKTLAVRLVRPQHQASRESKWQNSVTMRKGGESMQTP